MNTLARSRPLRGLLVASTLAFGCGSPPAATCPTAAPLAPPPAASVAPVASAAPGPSEPLPPPTPDIVLVSVMNAAAMQRSKETVSLSDAELKKVAPSLELAKALVFDANGAPVLSQVVAATAGGPPSELVFQSDFAASEQKTFRVRAGERKLPPTSAYQVYGRFVRERHDDFAWENDLVAHRMYGPDLETTKKEPLVSSGIDVWSKRVPRLLVNEWYMTDDYHQDHGDGADYYAVGKSRGCGGLGLWTNEKLVTSRNFVASRVIANGPIRLVFELDYAPWDIGGGKVSETKRVTLDAGTFFNRFESTFTTKRSPLAVAIGIAKHPGAVLSAEAATASMRVWEPVDGGKNGSLGCAVVLAPGSTAADKQSEDSYLFVTSAKTGEAFRYYVGSTWDRAAHVTSAQAWGETVHGLSARLASPLRVALSAGPGATP